MHRAMKRHSAVDDVQNVDRLSALPDGVLTHILSFMPTELSARTSILAKRWRFLWAHVPILDLKGGKSSSQGTTSFGGIICALMLRHKVERLNTFRLKYTDYDDGDDDVHTVRYEFETCIATAIERNVQNLDLFIDVELPVCVLTCKTLVDLRLSGGVSIPSSGPIYLPSLKKLYFQPPDDDVHFPRLVSGCPVLEDLVIDEPECFELEDCTISSPTLKRFTLCTSMYDPEFEFRLRINAPALRYLKVHEVWDWQLSVSPMNLIEADIILSPDYPHVLNFLDSICNVKCLELSGYYNCDIPTMPGSIVKFGSLTKLELTANWCFIAKFLESADHLQELIIHEGYLEDWDDLVEYGEDWVDPVEEGCACLLYSLRTVTVDGFSCAEQGFDMVMYILRNARVLEWMEIYWSALDLETEQDALQRISSFCRGSKECELVFY